MAKSSTRAKNKYNKTAYKQINLQVKPNIIDTLNLYCEKKLCSRSNFIVQAIKEKIERDTGKSFDEFLKENQPEQEQHQEQDQENADND